MESKPQTYPKTSDRSSSINHSQLESAHGLALIPTSWRHTTGDGNTLWTHLLHMSGTDFNVMFKLVRLVQFTALHIGKEPQKWSNMARPQGSPGSKNIPSDYLMCLTSIAELNTHTHTRALRRVRVGAARTQDQVKPVEVKRVGPLS